MKIVNPYCENKYNYVKTAYAVILFMNYNTCCIIKKVRIRLIKDDIFLNVI